MRLHVVLQHKWMHKTKPNTVLAELTHFMHHREQPSILNLHLHRPFQVRGRGCCIALQISAKPKGFLRTACSIKARTKGLLWKNNYTYIYIYTHTSCWFFLKIFLYHCSLLLITLWPQNFQFFLITNSQKWSKYINAHKNSLAADNCLKQPLGFVHNNWVTGHGRIILCFPILSQDPFSANWRTKLSLRQLSSR